METKLYVILGRTGDVLAALPIIQSEPKACVMVSREYADVLDGTSIERIVWDGDWRHVKAAYESVRGKWRGEIIVLQQYSTDGWPRWQGTDSFVKEMYRVARKLHLFPLPLTFDRRDKEREALWDIPFPFILLATRGYSSPFPHADELFSMVTQLDKELAIVNMDQIHAERIYDLLALFERAACLITIDSAMLHLAQATPQLPVIALIADHPSPWHGSPEYAGQRLRIRYRDFERNKNRIIETASTCLESAKSLGRGLAPTSPSNSELDS